MNKTLKEFKKYLIKYENMSSALAEIKLKKCKAFVADCLNTTNINVLKIKTSNEFKITMRAYIYINNKESKKFSFGSTTDLYNQFLLHKTIMEWL